MAMVQTLPSYVTDNTRAEGGHLIVFNLHRLSPEQARELYAMSYAHSLARRDGPGLGEDYLGEEFYKRLGEDGLDAARNFAAYALMPPAPSNDFPEDVFCMEPPGLARRYGVTEELAAYRLSHRRTSFTAGISAVQLDLFGRIFRDD